MSTLLTATEAAVIANRAPRNINKWITGGKLPAVKQHGKYFIDPADLRRVMTEMATNPHSKEARADRGPSYGDLDLEPYSRGGSMAKAPPRFRATIDAIVKAAEAGRICVREARQLVVREDVVEVWAAMKTTLPRAA